MGAAVPDDPRALAVRELLVQNAVGALMRAQVTACGFATARQLAEAAVDSLPVSALESVDIAAGMVGQSEPRRSL
jgi:hypothetical protein